MTHKPFEKQIADKLNRYEVQPGEEMLQSIFEKRAARRKPFMNLAKVFLAASVVTVAIYALYTNNDKHNNTVASAGETTVKQADMQQDKPVSTPQEETVFNTGKTENVQIPAAVKNKADKKATRIQRRLAGKDHSKTGQVRVRETGRTDDRRHKHPEAGSAYADNGDDIYNRYFNIDASRRPMIASSRHKGNSHLYVYHAVSEEVLDANTFSFMSLNPLRKFKYAYELQDYEKAAHIDAGRPTLSRPVRKPLFIDLLYTPVLTSARAADNSNLENYVNAIAGNTYSAQFGIRVSKPVTSRLSVFSGLAYNDQACLYKGIVTRPEEVTTINQVITYINDPVNGSMKVTTYDTVTGMVDKQTGYNYRNSYKMFQIPVGMSYNFGYKKFNFALNGSALVNMISRSAGQSMDLNNHNTREFSSSGKYVGLGGGFSFMAALQVSPRFRFIFEPGLQYFKINSLKAGNNVNEKVFNKQLSIGLRYTVF